MELIIIFALLIFIGYLGSNKKKSTPAPQFLASRPTPLPKKPVTDIIDINNEKLDLFNKIENSVNHFFVTGKAGTGKSLLLQYIRKHSSKKIVIAAPTGVAALNIGGQTIHSLFCIPPSFVAPESLLFNQKTAELLRHVDMILIDEISMVRADLMDAIDFRLRQSRDDSRPFGGVQIVMFGDLYQLPPIVTDRELHKYFSDNLGGFHFFHASVWKKAEFDKYELQEVFRQKDQEFRDILNAIRVGDKSPAILNQINSRLDVDIPEDGYVHLCSTNSKAGRINSTKLESINEPEFTYKAIIEGELDEKSYPADETLKLKKGAQVMLLKNDSEKRWVNGTLGKVSSLSDTSIKIDIEGIGYTVPLAIWKKIKYVYNRETKEIEEEPISSFTQFPVRLAWAMTIHKAQGKTFDRVVVDLEGGSFAPGQTYVALSRCTSLDGIFLTDKIYSEDIKVDPDVVKFMTQITPPDHFDNEVFTDRTEIIETDSKEETTVSSPPLSAEKEAEYSQIFPDLKKKPEKKKIPQELDW